MAEKNRTAAAAAAPAPETASAPETLPVEELAQRLGTPAWTLRGTMAAYGWAAGKHLTESEFKAAVQNWLAAPMGRLEVNANAAS